MSNRTRLFLGLVFTTSAVLLLTSVRRRTPVENPQPIEIVPLTVGERFRAPLLRLGGESFAPAPCTIAVAINPFCSGCDALARTIAIDDDPRLGENLLWISSGNEQETIRFAETNRLDHSRVVFTTLLPDRTATDRMAALGIPMVPLFVILDERAHVLNRRFYSELPAYDSLTQICQT